VTGWKARNFAIRGEGREWAVMAESAFQDRCLQPLGHPSGAEFCPSNRAVTTVKGELPPVATEAFLFRAGSSMAMTVRCVSV
jgi:hypothetical protein